MNYLKSLHCTDALALTAIRQEAEGLDITVEAAGKVLILHFKDGGIHSFFGDAYQVMNHLWMLKRLEAKEGE